jgi:kynurenine 3-monooxygenase
MSKKEKIIVVGGGLAGSLFAVCLAKKGFDVDVYERRPDMRKDDVDGGRSINLALSTRGLHALSKIGLDQEILKQAIPMNGRMMHSIDGELTYQPYGKDGQYINSVSRAGLNRRLLELADENENVDLHFNHRCDDCDLEKNEVYFTDENGQAKTVKADYIIATDGAFSAIRLRMQKTNRFDFSQDYQDYGYKELEITPEEGGAFKMEKNALHIWPRGNYMMIALPNPDGSYTCTLFMPFEGENSFGSLKTDEQIMEFLAHNFADSIPLMPNVLEDYKANPVGSLVTVRCNPWVRGNFALMGDSAHAVVPFYGQGMNCAFEDAAVLDDLIGKHYPNWELIFSEYEKERIHNANAIADLAIKNFKEMRDLVGQEDFLEKKRIEHELCELYPEHYKSQYELVTFSTEDYSYAQAMGDVNDGIIETIKEKGLANRLSDKDAILPILQSAKR